MKTRNFRGSYHYPELLQSIISNIKFLTKRYKTRGKTRHAHDVSSLGDVRTLTEDGAWPWSLLRAPRGQNRKHIVGQVV